MARPRIWHALLLLPLVAVAVWIFATSRAVREDPADVLRALRATHGPSLPAPASAGSSARSEPATYDRNTLYEYIDGAAEAYLSRGFERCVAATYTFAGAGGTLEVSAEVYRFAAVAGAREQMLSERPADSVSVAGLAEVFGDSVTLVTTRDRDYLKLTALTSGVEARGALTALAAAWARERP